MTAASRHAVVSGRGARRWAGGHPWIYRSDVRQAPDPAEPGVVAVRDARHRPLGEGLWSPVSEIRLRMLTRAEEGVDAAWWERRLTEALARRAGIDATAYRVVHAEADGLPSLVVDRYGAYTVAQLLSAGLEACRSDVLTAIQRALEPDGVLLRNDVPIRRHEELPQEVELVAGSVPRDVEVEETGVRYLAAPWSGQKTGAFLDQRENRALAGRLARGRALDVFAYHGSFALHLARGAERVVAVEESGEAIERARRNAALNGLSNLEWTEANAFDFLRGAAASQQRYDVIVLDPPAFARTRDAVTRALAGYKEINLRAMRALAAGGHLLTFSCSWHVDRAAFGRVLADAARDSGRRVAVEAWLGQASDHPEIVNIPETGYLKGALLRALE